MNDFRFGTIVWGLVVAVLIVCITVSCLVGNEQAVRSEKQCLDAGKSLLWTTLEGADNAKQECK